MYVDDERRGELEFPLDDLTGEISTVADLQYVIETIALRCLMGGDPDLETRVAIHGSLVTCEREFHDRFVKTYLDQQRDEQGDLE